MGATNPKAWMLRFHTQTGGATLHAQQPENNIMRVTLQALAAVMGGTQSLHTNGFDEALSLPTEAAARTALRTQQIIAYESGVVDTVDPMGGSYFIEELTNQIEAAAWDYIAKIDAMGGSVSAIEQGYMQKEIANASYQYQMNIEKGSKVIVGVNKFNAEHDAMPPIMRVDDSIRIGQMERLKQLRANRNNELVNAGLNQISEAAKNGNNLMPLLVDAVENYTTLGEIADTLRDVFGEYKA
jgi:methylmalonyl-CoA mutase N-terminal domain/subunit